MYEVVRCKQCERHCSSKICSKIKFCVKTKLGARGAYSIFSKKKEKEELIALRLELLALDFVPSMIYVQKPIL